VTSSLDPLAPWNVELAFLDDAVTLGLGAMIRQLEDLLGASRAASPKGMPAAGFDGIDRRGRADRLLLSEWMLAAELPEEFERRVAEGEALYLRDATDDADRTARMVAIFDTGATSLGAPRLVQLAALVVLARRARTRGVPLAIGLLGDPARGWIEGEFPDLFDAWLHGRAPHRPTVEQVAAWQANLEAEDTPWWFVSREVAGIDLARGGGHSAVVTEDFWSADRVNVVKVEVAGRTIRLTLPEPDLAIAALRGRSVRRLSTRTETLHNSIRWPVFHGADRRLLARGDGPDELVVIPVPRTMGGESGRVKRHRLGGPILAASPLGRRIVALVWKDGLVRCQVIGKALALTARIEATLPEVGLTDAELEDLGDQPIGPLVFQSGDVIARLGGSWWRLSVDQITAENIAAVAPGRALDTPRIARCWGGLLGVDDKTVRLVDEDSSPVPGADHPAVVLGAQGGTAFSHDNRRWTLTSSIPSPDSRAQIELEDGSTVLGLIEEATLGTALVVRSRGGQIVRLVTPDASRALTRLSSDLVHAAAHPVLPLVVAQRSDGSTVVVESSGAVLCNVKAAVE